MRRRRLEFVLLALLILGALCLRLPLIGTDPYGDEAVHYSIAKHFGQPSPNVEAPPGTQALFAGRPLFFLASWPGAVISFEAFRVEHLAFAALLPAAVALVARSYGARPVAWFAAGAAVVLHPLFLLYSVRVFPDTLMALAVCCGLVARRAERPNLSAGLLVAAVWIKESAIAVVAFLVAVDVWNAFVARQIKLWPLRLEQNAARGVATLVLSGLPLLALLALGGRFPGWTPGGATWPRLDPLLLTAWMLPFLVAGLAWPRSRPLSAVALVLPAFYMVWRIGFGRNVEDWYALLPAALAIAAVAVLLDEAASSRPTPAARAVLGLLVVFLGAMLILPVVAPSDLTAGIAQPLSHQARASLPQLWHGLRSGHELQHTMQYLDAHPPREVLLVDVGWYFIEYPFADHAPHVRYRYSDGTETDATLWAKELEDANITSVLWVYEGGIVNRALRSVYADCASYANPSYVVLEGVACQGHEERLREALAPSAL